MCCYCNCWCHIIYLFLCYHSHFTWCHPWRSSRFPFYFFSFGTSLGATLGGIPFFGVCTLGDGVWCCFYLVGHRCVIGAITWSGSTTTFRHHPLCLLIGCFSAFFVMMLKSSAILINTIWCVSFILVNGVFGVGFVIISLNILLLALVHQQFFYSHILRGGLHNVRNSLWSCFCQIILCNTYSVPTMVRYTTPILHVWSMYHIDFIFHVKWFSFPLVPWICIKIKFLEDMRICW